MTKLICLLCLIICANSFGYSVKLELFSNEVKVKQFVDKVNGALEGFSKIEVEDLGVTEDNWFGPDKYSYDISIKEERDYVVGHFVRYELPESILLGFYGDDAEELKILHALGIKYIGTKNTRYTYMINSLEIPLSYLKE